MPYHVQTLESIKGNWRAGMRRPLLAGQELHIGRSCEVTIANDPIDDKVSRTAAIVVPNPEGWRIEPRNRNGVVLHQWAQPPRPITRTETVLWPRVGLFVKGAAEYEHWILLDDTEAYTALGPHTTGVTATTELPEPLTPEQLEAVYAVFHEILAWPPVRDARPDTVDTAARRIGRSRTALNQRLDQARRRATGLGLRREPARTDPEYVYVLARAGFIRLDAADQHGNRSGAGRAT
ncbi:hypothetical protein Daura_14475 [Dactylosporangium aurantiacum]|uniref:FHA domain-containing protein n=1 Tax=Dactylosporangium aurantiacum TaxID=35754 RepID=A0A9Q9MHY2_9ACTN|nr:hypothetical protein [Dactylosporangium aurantiacum]MDG6108599.1 hypothetical protein [Dactylosporangium aurantiacum]UWZ57264.1 hypothetical protein Daura_14475 [Dactylosporangium aurantiacum]